MGSVPDCQGIQLANGPSGGGRTPGYRLDGERLEGELLDQVVMSARSEWRMADWPHLWGIELTDCTIRYGLFLRTVLDGITAGLANSVEIRAENCVLRQVRISGTLRELWVEFDDVERFRWLRREYLGRDPSSDDWALDVSGLDCKDLTIRGVDPSTVRIDPQRQAFLSAAELAPAREQLSHLDLPGTIGYVVRKAMEGRTGTFFVSVAPRSRTAVAERDLLRFLHAEGLTVSTAATGG